MSRQTTAPMRNLLPVLFGFFIMGFVDVVGISTTYAKEEFNLSETLAGFIPSMVFFWFLLLSIPTALFMNRIGRKKTVQISNVITIIGMMIPFISYNLVTCMVAFALLGIGNTIIQVSLNPLLTNVVKGDKLSSSLTTGQILKAISAFVAPFIAAFCVRYLGSWTMIFPIFAGITLVSTIWLSTTRITEQAPDRAATFGQAFGLLSDRMILLCFLGIFFVVGTDVGVNTVTPKLLIERAGLSSDAAGLGSSVYFLCRTVGALIGATLLTRVSDMKYYRIHILIAILAMLVLFFATERISILAMVGLTGYAISSMFSVIFSQALKARPDKANEISGLMVTGIFGGAVIPPLMGWATDSIGTQVGSLLVISICVLYLAAFSLMVKTNN